MSSDDIYNAQLIQIENQADKILIDEENQRKEIKKSERKANLIRSKLAKQSKKEGRGNN